MKRLTVAAAIGFAILLIPLFAYYSIPVPQTAKIPVHWDASLQVNKYVSAEKFIWYLLGAVLAYVFLAVTPYIYPRRKNVESFETTYALVLVGLSLVFSAILLSSELYAVGYVSDPTTIIRVALAAIFLITGAAMCVTRSNWIIGVRTPWGLESEKAWRVSNRIGGISLAIAGAFFFLGVSPYLVLRIIVGGSIVAVIAAYLVWRRENES